MESSKGKRKRKREKLTCLVCNRSFDDDYRNEHNKKYHDDLLKAGKSISYKVAGAPANPFVLAAQIHKEKVSQTKNDPESSGAPLETLTVSAGESVAEKDSQPSKSHNVDTAVLSSKASGSESDKSHKDETVESYTVEDVNKETEVSEGDGNITWLQCAGLLHYLKFQLRNVEGIMDEVASADNPNQEHFLSKVVETADQVRETASELVKRSSQVLKNIEKEKMTLEDSNENYFSPAIPPLDPALRSRHLTDSQKTYLIQIGPNQPHLQAYPTNPSASDVMREGHKQSRFNPSWYKDYPHLEYSISKDAAFCFVCSLFSSGPGMEKAESAWSTEGVRTWHKFKSCGKAKPGKLATHFSSTSHKSAVLAYANFVKTSGHVDVLLSKARRQALIQEEEDLIHNRKIVEILLDVTKTLGRQSIAFRGHGDDKEGNFQQIVMMMARHCPDLKAWFNTTRMRPYRITYLSAHSQNEFIQLIGHQLQKQIAKEIEEAHMYSVMADTTPDVSHKDRLALACRYVDANGQPRERLMSLTEAKDKTGEGGAREIIEALNKHEINLDDLCFQSYDYAASMSGRFNGVQKKIQDKLGRRIPYMPCLAHRSNTVIEHSCEASAIITELFNVLEELYVFFTSSTKRISSLKEHIDDADIDNPLQLRNLSKTRWVARAESIKAVWSTYEAILKSLTDLKERSTDGKTKTASSGLLAKITQFDFIVCIMFMKNIMYKTKRMTEILQKEELNIIDAITIMESTIKSLESVANDSDAMNAEIQAATVFAERLGVDVESDFRRHHRLRKPPRRIDDNPSNTVALSLESFYRKEFKAVLDTQITRYKEVYNSSKETTGPLIDVLHPSKGKAHWNRLKTSENFSHETNDQTQKL
ncbi:zinc finger MYM-type protein 1-like [Dendronephthya gigantea]|uniref:zinc finger MYM-type protein 1-like n=1 Tax=Dendronephthya gigantea TaxID=151771 RepID=UPI001068DF1D|nr:zinc finger MYM-type protein 1-like [Dendronephthya gigantea]